MTNEEAEKIIEVVKKRNCKCNEENYNDIKR